MADLFRKYTNGRMTVLACLITEENIDKLMKLIKGKEIAGGFIDKHNISRYSIGDAIKKRMYSEDYREHISYSPIRKKTFEKYKEMK